MNIEDDKLLEILFNEMIKYKKLYYSNKKTIESLNNQINEYEKVTKEKIKELDEVNLILSFYEKKKECKYYNNESMTIEGEYCLFNDTNYLNCINCNDKRKLV